MASTFQNINIAQLLITQKSKLSNKENVLLLLLAQPIYSISVKAEGYLRLFHIDNAPAGAVQNFPRYNSQQKH
jgi:hypothetical protein